MKCVVCAFNENGMCTAADGVYAYNEIPDENEEIECDGFMDIACEMALGDALIGGNQLGLF